MSNRKLSSHQREAPAKDHCRSFASGNFVIY